MCIRDSSIASVPSGFVDKVIAYATNISTINWTATAVGAAAIVIMLLWPKVTDKIPGALIAIIVTTAVVYFAKLPVNTIGSVYGELSSSFQTPHVPALSMKLVQRCSHRPLPSRCWQASNPCCPLSSRTE